jgi:type VI secretion system protein ImpK
MEKLDRPLNNLALCFQEPLTAIVRVRSGRQQVQDAETFRDQIRRALQGSMQEARTLGYPGEMVQSAVFAVVALLDESVLNLQNPVFSEWARRPLQEELFGGHNAGEVFFRNLNGLLTRQDSPETADCLEVYCLCLLLGFKGRYALGGGGELQASIRRAREKMERSRGPSHLPQVQSSSESRPDGGARDRFGRGLAYAAAVACVITLLTFGAFYFVLTSGTSRIQTSTATTR